MKHPQAHAAHESEACNCVWCGQRIEPGDWIWEGRYCSAGCAENDAEEAGRPIASGPLRRVARKRKLPTYGPDMRVRFGPNEREIDDDPPETGLARFF